MFNKASDTLSDYYYFQADIKGNSSVPDMSGTARFYPWLDGTMVEIELTGMPTRNEPFAVHIHEGAVCEPEAFTSAGMHLKNTDVELEVSPERHETNIKTRRIIPGIWATCRAFSRTTATHIWRPTPTALSPDK